MHQELLEQILIYQKSEITEHALYKMLAAKMDSPEQKEVLERIAGDEYRHYQEWRKHTGRDVNPDKLKAWRYYIISRMFGLTFGTKLMEKREEDVQECYEKLKQQIPEIESIISDENQHEELLLKMLDEERLHYLSSMVLGVNDALVELTGVVAGLTLSLQSTPLIVLSALTTGIAAALSMGASEYLSTKSEKTDRNPVKASLYTGGTYISIVILLVLPYLFIENPFVSLTCTLGVALLVIILFNYYLSIVQDTPFKKRFLEMGLLSFSVAAVSFVLGYLLRVILKVEV